MSERIHHIDKAPEELSTAEKSSEHRQENKIEKRIEQAAHETQANKERAESARQKIHEQAKNTEQLKISGESDRSHSPADQLFVNKELKEMAYRRTLSRVRQQMSVTDRLVSRIIHQPVVNTVSEVMSKTIGRPSGLLGGGLLSLVGTSTYYYITKHYGYGYNYLIFLLLIAGGFIVGWLVEILWYLLSSRKKII